MLYGNSDSEPQTDIVVAQVAQEFYNSNLLYSLICNLNKIDFEVSSHLNVIISNSGVFNGLISVYRVRKTWLKCLTIFYEDRLGPDHQLSNTFVRNQKYYSR